MSKRDAYVEKMKAQLDQWNAELDRLEARRAEAEADTRLEIERQLASLRSQRDETRTKLRELESASDAAFDDLRRGVDHAWDSMSQAFREAMSRFR